MIGNIFIPQIYFLIIPFMMTYFIQKSESCHRATRHCIAPPDSLYFCTLEMKKSVVIIPGNPKKCHLNEVNRNDCL